MAPEIEGFVILTWPEAEPSNTLLGFKVAAQDANTGDALTGCLKADVHVDPKGIVLAELDMLYDEAGNYGTRATKPTSDGEDGFLHRVSTWAVTEMRVAA